MFLVEKITGSWRLVIGPFPLNKFLRQTKLRWTVSSVWSFIRKGDLMSFFNLNYFYFQVPIWQASRMCVCFILDGIDLSVHGTALKCCLLPSCSLRCLILVLSLGFVKDHSYSSQPWLAGYGSNVLLSASAERPALPVVFWSGDYNQMGESRFWTQVETKVPLHADWYKGEWSLRCRLCDQQVQGVVNAFPGSVTTSCLAVAANSRPHVCTGEIGSLLIFKDEIYMDN